MSSAHSSNNSNSSNYVSTGDGDVQITSKNPKTGHRHTRTLSGFLDAARVSDDGNTSADVNATSSIVSSLMQRQQHQYQHQQHQQINYSNTTMSNNSAHSSSSISHHGTTTTTVGIMKPSSHNNNNNNNNNNIMMGNSRPPPGVAHLHGGSTHNHNYMSSNNNTTTTSSSVRYDAMTLKRHRRGQSSSGGGSAVLHRRVNSIGSSVVIPKSSGSSSALHHAHQREDSEGLDMLSAVADCFTEEEMAAAAGSNKGVSSSSAALKSSLRQRHSRGHSLIGGPIDLTLGTNIINNSISGSGNSSGDTAHQNQNHHHGGHKQHARSSSLLGSLDHTGTALLMSLLPGSVSGSNGGITTTTSCNNAENNNNNKPGHERNDSLFPLPDAAASKHERNFSIGGDSMNSINPNLFGCMNALSPIPGNDHLVDAAADSAGCTATNANSNTGAHGYGNSGASVDTNKTAGNRSVNGSNVPSMPMTTTTAASQAAVQEAMYQGFASYSKFPLQQSAVQMMTSTHHRPQSSTTKFLMSLEESIDTNIPGGSDFLRTLAMSNDTDANKLPIQNFFRPPPISSFSSARPKSKPKVSIEIGGRAPFVASSNGSAVTRPLSKPVPARAKSPAVKSPPPRGTCKRVRRKCNAGGCPNRVVQGGLCISHGAKRKVCSVAGCDKNVKKAGLCSAHGPARKRCENEGCNKVAVQGGKCISHGARKKLCEYDGCTKQAILSGMCKKHRDEKMGLRAPAAAPAPATGPPKRRQRAVHAPLVGNTVFPLSSNSPVAGAPVCMVIGSGKVEQTRGMKKLPSPPHHTRRESFRGDNATVEAIFKDNLLASTGEMIHAASNPVAGSNNRFAVAPRSSVFSQARLSQHPPPAEQPVQESNKPGHKHKRGISLFTEESVADTILQNGNLII